MNGTKLFALTFLLVLAASTPAFSSCASELEDCLRRAEEAYDRCLRRHYEESICYNIYERQVGDCYFEYYNCLYG